MGSFTRSLAASVGRAVTILVLVVLAATLLVCIDTLIRDAMVMKSDQAPLEIRGDSLQLWLGVLALCIALFLVFGLWKLVRLLYTWMLGENSPFGASLSGRMLGLGVAVLLFPRGIQWLLVTPVLVFADLARSLPDRIVDLLQRSRSHDMKVSIEDALTRLLDLARIVAYALGESASRLFDASSVSDLVLALLVWVLVSRFFDNGSGRSDVHQWFVELDAVRRRTLVLACVFVMGVFLSVASIVAIPYLQDEKPPANLGRENLEKSLEPFKTKPADLEGLLSQGLLGSKPLDVLVPTSAASAASAPASPSSQQGADRVARTEAQGTAGLGRSPPELAELVARVQRLRDGATTRALTMRAGLSGRQTRVIEMVAAAFETEMRQQMSTQERINFYRQLQLAAQRELAVPLQDLEDCQRALTGIDSAVESVGQQLSAIRPDSRVSGSYDQFYFAYNAVVVAAAPYGRICVDRAPMRSEFVAPEAGAGWGPFGWVANWLLRTRSFALTLITGMLGFGLLGASISSFVRTESGSAEASPTLVGQVVIRGVSAAVVVFLAAKGGLAILASGNSEPNAYVLFFTCLVGAVFSEDVWTWARVRFKEKFLENEESEGGGRDGEKAQTRLRPARQPSISPKRKRAPRP